MGSQLAEGSSTLDVSNVPRGPSGICGILLIVSVGFCFRYDSESACSKRDWCLIFFRLNFGRL